MDVAALLAAVPLVAAAVRIWIFSRGDLTVFRTLLSTLDITAVLVGTFVQLVPIVVVWGVIFLLTDWRLRDRFSAWAERNGWIRYVILPTVFIMVFTLPFYWVASAILGIAVPAVVFVLLRKRWRWGREHILDVIVAPRGDPNGPNTSLNALLLFIIVLMSSSTMWLPLEKVERTEPDDAIVGYVLASDELWTTILSSGNEVFTVPSDEVQERSKCDGVDHFRLAELLVIRSTSSDGPIVDCRS